ncbi:YihY/virulence factor BrkB family protein [Nocardioides alcanivorans]|uniref:YihY/virulence factor BrkB family protein n=1 Tax=Nocardioides alcanivorans TaxID=2897352 RepID=UPI001F1CFEDD|nr:YihY/virulence factor BrkB family protein [Nocardioides alcanivorans]
MLGRVLLRVLRAMWRVTLETVKSCVRYRVTGLAAEAAFFAVLSIPPLVFALAGSVGFITGRFTDDEVGDVRAGVLNIADRAMTDSAVDKVIRPTINAVLDGGRFDVMSIGFLLALWSGSRALNVFVDTISIMHGLGGERGIVRTRVLSFSLYVLGLLIGAVTIPLVLVGPRLAREWLPDRLLFAHQFYWPTVVVLCICFLATLYHVSIPVATQWRYQLPGATFALFVWIFGSFLLRWFLMVTATDSRSIFGPLAAPIAVLLWLYLVSIAVLIGAAVNASVDLLFPQLSTTRARELLRRWSAPLGGQAPRT